MVSFLEFKRLTPQLSSTGVPTMILNGESDFLTPRALRQQTRVAAFLVSCHGAMASQLALALALQTKAAWHTEFEFALYRESEIVSLLLRATLWTPDPELLFLLPSWEAAWLPRPTEGVHRPRAGVCHRHGGLGHAPHAVIRPAALLPESVPLLDPFALPCGRSSLKAVA
jgi:hypothetical protein